MRPPRRRTLATVFCSAALTIAASSAAPARQSQAPAAKTKAGVGKLQAPARPAAGKTDAAGLPQPPKAVDDPAARRKMEDLLVRWEAQSKTVKSLSVKYTRTDVSLLFDAKTVFEGEAKLKSPDFVYLDFYEVVEGKKKEDISERIVCDGKNVYQFLGPPKRIFVYPMDKDAQMKALNQGPLPFLFNMSAAKAKARYDMQFISEGKDYYVILITPKLAIDREEYSQAKVKLRRLDNGRFLPEAIRLWSPEGKDTKTFTFGNDALEENAVIADGWFNGPNMVSDASKYKNPKNPQDRWVVVFNPGPDGKPQAAPGVGAKPAPKGAAPRR